MRTQHAKKTRLAENRKPWISGEGGIRTLGELAPTPVFETGPIGHSGTSPSGVASDYRCPGSPREAGFPAFLNPFQPAPSLGSERVHHRDFPGGARGGWTVPAGRCEKLAPYYYVLES